MGWSYIQNTSRDKLIKHLVTSRRATAYQASPTILWSICQGRIYVDLLEGNGTTWGYKTMSEAEGPYYYSCPLDYLGMTPVVNAKWREKVHNYHKEHYHDI